MIRVVSHCSQSQLKVLIRAERDAHLRDRLRAILWIVRGEKPAEIAERLGRQERIVWTWLRRYNERGPQGLAHRRGAGRPRALTSEQEARVVEFVERRARDLETSRRVHGEEVREFIEEELGVAMPLATAYKILHRLGYELIRPRPRHEKNNPAVMKKWKEEQAPLLSSKRKKSTPTRRSRSGYRTKRASGRRGR